MAVVSHLTEIKSEPQPYGCRVRASEFDDSVFCSAEPVHFDDGAISFRGTAGIIRRMKDQFEFALFHGTKIGMEGFTFTTSHADLGIGGTIAVNQHPRGLYYAPTPASIRITLSAASERTAFYMDGAAQTTRRDGDALIVDLPQGAHRWELTDGLPIPIAPQIVRTENHSDGARVIIAPVAAASQYRLEISKDNGATWVSAAVTEEPEVQIHGLAEGEKVHLRALALNAAHESEPGSEYPLYVSKEPPPPPDGLNIGLFNGSARLTWGEVLGVSEYRLYVRRAPNQEFRLLYRGLDRSFTYHDPAIRAPLDQPEKTTPQPILIEYCVSCASSNGEGPRSRIENTDPGSWRNWNPMPGERFRRVFEDMSPSASIRVPTKWPRYYPH